MPGEIKLNVYFQNNDYVRQLEQDRAEAEKRAEEWKLRCDRLIIRVADEQRINLQLIDLLQAHGIKYRFTSDMRTW